MTEILLLGGGGHCKAVIDVIERCRQWTIIGIVESADSGVKSVCGYPVVGSDDDLNSLYRPNREAIVTVGQIKSSNIRRMLFEKAMAAGFVLPSVVAPTATVARTAKIGAGSVIMNFAHIGPDACIGENVIVNTRATVEHDAIVGSHCHISTGALINGGVCVGGDTFVGSGSVCRESITVGSGCLIGMGALVRKSLDSQTVAY